MNQSNNYREQREHLNGAFNIVLITKLLLLNLQTALFLEKKQSNKTVLLRTININWEAV